jgi:hypothetical protein
MKWYRAYWLDGRRRITRGDWLEALDDEDAARKARELCNEETHTVEVWQQDRPVEEIDCHAPA